METHQTKSLLVFLPAEERFVCHFFPFSLFFVNLARFRSKIDYLFVKAVEKEMKECIYISLFSLCTFKSLVEEDLLFVQVHMPTTKLFCY